MFIKKSSPSEETFNADAKILITHILCTRATPEAYLEPSYEGALSQKETVSNFFKNALSQILDWVLKSEL